MILIIQPLFQWIKVLLKNKSKFNFTSMTFKRDIQLLCWKSDKVEETSEYADSKTKMLCCDVYFQREKIKNL